MPELHIGPSSVRFNCKYNSGMTNNEEKLPPELERYLALCKRVYERMLDEGTWPWPDDVDSTDNENLIESDDNLNDV